MLSKLGNILLLGSVFFTLSIIYLTFQNVREKNFQIKKNLVYFSVFQITFTISSFFLLIFAFIFSDFSLLAVYQNSHTAKPIFYKIAGVWGNHEGSLLLWVNIMVIFSGFDEFGAGWGDSETTWEEDYKGVFEDVAEVTRMKENRTVFDRATTTVNIISSS